VIGQAFQSVGGGRDLLAQGGCGDGLRGVNHPRQAEGYVGGHAATSGHRLDVTADMENIVCSGAIKMANRVDQYGKVDLRSR